MHVSYVMCFVAGVVGLLGSLLIGETHGGDSGPGLLSLNTLATAVFGFGAGALGAGLTGAGEPVPLLAGIALALAMVFAVRGLLIPYLLRQQSNSHFSRASYVGLVGRVEIGIPAGGWGEISLAEPTGARIRVKARSDETESLAPATQVYITDLEGDAVRVIAISGHS